MDLVNEESEKVVSNDTQKDVSNDIQKDVIEHTMISVNLSTFEFPSSIKMGELFSKLLEEANSESDKDSNTKTIDISSKHMCFIKTKNDVRVLSDINQFINILDSYRYWLVEVLPFEAYDLILLNYKLILINLNIVRQLFLESYWNDIDTLVYFSLLDVKFKMIHNPDINSSKKRKIQDDIISEDSMEKIADKEYYFNEEIRKGISLKASPIIKVKERNLLFYSHYLLSKDYLKFILYFKTKGYNIPRNICLMCARANNLEALKFFHELGYKLYDNDDEAYNVENNNDIEYYNNIDCLVDNNQNVIYTNAIYITMTNIKFSSLTDSFECFQYCLEHYLKDGKNIEFDMLATACICNNEKALSAMFDKFFHKIQFRSGEYVSRMVCRLLNYATFNKSVKCINFIVKRGYRWTLNNLLVAIHCGQYYDKTSVFDFFLKKIKSHHPEFSINEINKIYYITLSNEKSLSHEDLFCEIKYFYDLGHQFTSPICCYAIEKNNELAFKFIFDKLDKTEITSKILEAVAKYMSRLDIMELCIKKGCPINEKTYNFLIGMSKSNPDKYLPLLDIIHQYYDSDELSKFTYSNITTYDIYIGYSDDEFLFYFYDEFIQDYFAATSGDSLNFDYDDDEPYVPTDVEKKVFPKNIDN